MQSEYEGLFEGWELSIARKIVRNHLEKRFGRQGADEDFILSGCLNHWYLKRHTYRPEGEANPQTYMARVVKNYLMSLLRKDLAEKRKIDRLSESLDRPIDPENPEFTLLDKVSADLSPKDFRLQLDVKAALSKLSPRQRDICHLLKRKATKTDVAHELGLNRDTIHREIRRIREIFRRDGLGE